MEPQVLTAIEKDFWPKVERRGPDECWPWLASKAAVERFGGYGQMKKHRKILLAHRVAYELLRGPIPSGLTIDHLCRNRSCVNPAHLEAVPIRENVLRGSGPTARNARKTHAKCGHPFDIQYGNKRYCKKCLWEKARMSMTRWRARQVAKKQSTTGEN